MNDQIIYIDTQQCHPPQPSTDLREGRANFAKVQQELNGVEVTVMVLAYNRLDKTKRCIESILRNTKQVDYELLLIDNGSTDGTLEYFKEVPHEKKKIVRISHNLEAVFAFSVSSITEIGRYLVLINNDVLVTPNWLDNLLVCASSDSQIGMVCPVSSNVSNLQNVDLDFRDLDEMQEKAREFNRTDAGKWQERLRLIPVVMLLKKEALLAIGYPFVDCGFYHDFSDDDLAFRVRRAGYKAILAGDVWVHHDHDYRHMENKDPKSFQESLEIGKQNFQDKYFGVDAWGDVNNFLLDLAGQIRPPKHREIPRILGIDTKCGTPILDIRNKLREYGCMDARASAFSQDSKYFMDLKTICQDIVVCDREEFLRDSFPENFYDYVVLGRPINQYHEPQKLLEDLLRMAKRGAQLLLPLYNTFSFYEYLNALGNRQIYNPNLAYDIPFELMEEALKKTCRIQYITGRPHELSERDLKFIKNMIPPGLSKKQEEESVSRMIIENFWFVAEKL